MSRGLPAGARWWRTDAYVPAGERLERAFRPSPWFILLHAPGALVLIALLIALGAAWGLAGPGAREAGWLVVRIGVGALVVHLAIGLLRWLSRLYAVTDRRVVVAAGVLAQVAGDVPLERVQHVTMERSFVERLLGLGTVGVATAGADGAAVSMLMVARPASVMAMVRRLVDDARGRARIGRGGVTVIGLAGGIGAGKSEVARHLKALGCVVIDSDQEAKAALDRDDVRRELVRWWGEGVLGDDGRIDRKRVAEIIFGDASERQRLEGLVHPIVRSRRAEVVERAAGAGARAAVIDAPLLFEAGVDAECDVVAWVEAPRAVRLERVSRTRGWDEAELERRERAQWPLERKRALCRYEILNDGSPGLEGRVRATLERALSEVSPGVGAG